VLQTATGLVALLGVVAPASPVRLAPTLRCVVSGYGECSNGKCSGAGTSEPTVRLTISRNSHSVNLNQLEGNIDRGVGDPYSKGWHNLTWRRGLVAYESYQINELQPGGLIVTLRGGDKRLEFRCQGSPR